MTKLCKVLVDTTTGQKYALVRGKLLTQQEALGRDILFGYIDVAPIPQTGLISQMQVLYTNLTLQLTDELETVTLPDPEKQEDIPQELLSNAQNQAAEEATSFFASLGSTIDYTTSSGGTNE